MNKYREYLSQNPVIFAFIAAISVIFVVLVVISVMQRNDESTKKAPTNSPVDMSQVKSSNLISALKRKGLSYQSVVDVWEALKKEAKANGLALDAEELSITVRDDSFKKYSFNEYNLVYVNFIVDIEDKKQSYQISHEWSKDQNNDFTSEDFTALAFCIVDKGKVKFNDFNCDDGVIKQPKTKILSHYSQYANADGLPIVIYEEDPNTVYIDTTNRFDENIRASFASAKDWIGAMGFPNDGMKYKTEYSGGAPEIHDLDPGF